jgi:GNAT superfamily N-acetyltransferase
MNVALSLNILPSTIEEVERDAWIDLYAAAPIETSKRFGLQAALFGNVPALAGPEIPISEFNRAFMLDDSAVTDLDEAFRWLNCHASPEFALQIAADEMVRDLQNWAVERGFSPSGNGWSKLVRTISSNEDGAEADDERFEIITNPEASVYGDLVVNAFGLPQETRDWFSALVGRPGWTVLVVLMNGEPVGSGALFVKGQWGWFGIDGTLDHARRQGVQSMLIKARARLARSRGARYLTAETGRPEHAYEKHTSRENYLRNGFTEAYHRSNYKRSI